MARLLPSQAVGERVFWRARFFAGLSAGWPGSWLRLKAGQSAGGQGCRRVRLLAVQASRRPVYLSVRLPAVQSNGGRVYCRASITAYQSIGAQV